MVNSPFEDTPDDTTTVVAPLRDEHTHTVVFLHGHEDYGFDLATSFFDSKASSGMSLAERFPTIKWVFPAADLRFSAQRYFELSCSSLEYISQWFDLWDLDAPQERQELMLPGLQESIGQIIDIIQEEARTISLDRIILGGISQGCATAVLALLSSGMCLHLGGFIGLCSWLPFETEIANILTDPLSTVTEVSGYIQSRLKMEDTEYNIDDKTSTVNKETVVNADSSDLEASLAGVSVYPRNFPVLLAHSNDDGTVPFRMGEALQKALQQLGFQVVWKEYQDGGHWIHPEKGVDDMITFLQNLGIKAADSRQERHMAQLQT